MLFWSKLKKRKKDRSERNIRKNRTHFHVYIYVCVYINKKWQVFTKCEIHLLQAKFKHVCHTSFSTEWLARKYKYSEQFTKLCNKIPKLHTSAQHEKQLHVELANRISRGWGTRRANERGTTPTTETKNVCTQHLIHKWIEWMKQMKKKTATRQLN